MIKKLWDKLRARWYLRHYYKWWRRERAAIIARDNYYRAVKKNIRHAIASWK